MRRGVAWITGATVAVGCVQFVAMGGTAQSRPASIEIAFVANAEAASVALVDVAARSIVATLDVNPAHARSEGPGAPNYAQDTDISPDGRTLYVSRGYVGDVAAFDIASRRMLWNRPLNTSRADHMTLTRDGRSLFVSGLLDNRVYKIATATGEIGGHLVTGVYPHDNKVSRDGRRLYNTSIGPIASLPRPSGAPPLTDTPGYPFQLTVTNVDTLEITDRIRLDQAFRPWQFASDEKIIYAQIANEHAVVAYDVAERNVIRRLELPTKPGVTVKDWDFEAPHYGLALTDDGRVCLIANTRSDDLSLISIPERKEIRRLPIGNGPKHITVARLPMSVIAAVKAVQ
jgi:DNA-binding beta-propeller fold protein YncE